MKWILVLLQFVYLMTFCIASLETNNEPWKYNPYFQVPAIPWTFNPFTSYVQIMQQISKSNYDLAKLIYMRNLMPFGYPNFNNGNVQSIAPPTLAPVIQATAPTAKSIDVKSSIPNLQSTVQPNINYIIPKVIDVLPTTRQPFLRKSNVKPVSDPELSPRIEQKRDVNENNGFIPTEVRNHAIQKTTNAPVTQRLYFTYPEIRNALNHKNYNLANIRGPAYGGLNVNSTVGQSN
ncbi:uncharacterized protein [Chironomus tepperi]|uniref:uncharacterized protein n=1 Tax=Chironomus tepperi TaxID=113505 RepID=UPI00391F7847